MHPRSIMERLGTILREAARARRLMTERDAIAALGWNDDGPEKRRQLAFLLNSVSTIQVRSHRVPMLAATIVSEDTGRPGRGFFALARGLGVLGAAEDEDRFWMAELARVYRFWGMAGVPER